MYRLITLVFAWMLLLAGAWGQAPADGKVRLSNGEWPPYLSPDMPHYGIASRIVTEAFAEVGIEVEYDFFPWSRAYYLAERGEWDGTAVWLKNPERQEAFFYSDPVISSGYVLFHRKDFNFDWEDYSDLKGLTLGATLEYDYGPVFKRAREEGLVKVEWVSRDILNFNKLLRGRIDLFASDRIVGLALLHKHYSPDQIRQITYHPRLMRADPLYLLLSRAVPENRERIKRFNEGLARLRARGRVEEILTEGLNTVLTELKSTSEAR